MPGFNGLFVENLAILRPHEGDTVRETVRVEVPATSIPPNGFASLFIDGLFRVAGNLACPERGHLRLELLPRFPRREQL